MVGLFKNPRGRGRPRKTVLGKDFGTVELQEKRQIVKNMLGHSPKKFEIAVNCALDGCLLSQLYLRGLISRDQLEAGYRYRRLCIL